MINYAAFDNLEDDIILCKRIVRDGVLNLAKLCVDFTATMVHEPIGFIFKSNIPKLMYETDIANPINIYRIIKRDRKLNPAKF